MIKRICLLILGILLCATANVWAQYKPTHKAAKLYNEALRDVNSGKDEDAARKLKKIVKKNPAYDKALLTLADILVMQKKSEEAVLYYQQLTLVAPDFSFKPWFVLGKKQLEKADYVNGRKYFGQVLQLKNVPKNALLDAQLYLSQCEFALEALKNPVDYEALNFGDSINSEVDEYLPSLTADDEMLIFTRRTPQSEDFYYSIRQADTFRTASPMPKPLNSVQNEGAHCLSADGNTLFFTACYRNDSYGGCDLYFSKRTFEGWDRPTNLGTTINTEHWESQPSISYDGKTLYFISNRPGGFGGSDIWFSRLKEDGSWGIPENLGELVNTRKDDISPFVHPDDQTLYFASEGLPGMGKLDIYLSKRDKSGAWGTPQNLGYPINTERDESSLFVNLAGTLALFSSQARDSRGANDLYYFELPPALRPEKVIYVKGIVKDKDSGRPLASHVEVVDLNTGEVVHNVETFYNDGRFIVSLPAGNSFAFNVNRQGYLLFSENFTIDSTRAASEVYNISLERIKVGGEVVLKNIFYQTNSFTLEDRSETELRKLAVFLQKNPNLVIEIQGHTDNIGTKAYNRDLSSNRAKTVFSRLVELGVNSQQIVYMGYGDSQPIADNETETGRASNRRTQFRVIRL